MTISPKQLRPVATKDDEMTSLCGRTPHSWQERAWGRAIRGRMYQVYVSYRYARSVCAESVLTAESRVQGCGLYHGGRCTMVPFPGFRMPFARPKVYSALEAPMEAEFTLGSAVWSMRAQDPNLPKIPRRQQSRNHRCHARRRSHYHVPPSSFPRAIFHPFATPFCNVLGCLRCVRW